MLAILASSLLSCSAHCTVLLENQNSKASYSSAFEELIFNRFSFSKDNQVFAIGSLLCFPEK